MATTSSGSGSRSHEKSEPVKEPERHPAQPSPAKPGVPQSDLQPKSEVEPEKPPEEKVLSKEDAMALFRGGHKLKKKGDPPEKWFAASRAHGVLAISRPVDEEVEKAINEQDLVLVPDTPPA
jgi:hypothetical protein